MKAATNPSFVVDASIAVAWAHPPQATQESADALRAFVDGAAVYAPSLWAIEVANALLVLRRRSKLTEEEWSRGLHQLSRLPVTLDHESATHAFARISELAGRYGLSCYDAVYLELALRRALPLACKDGLLRNAAAKAGVTLWRSGK
jgi:predicted nucleic acid-binding protein